jgi:hypothetical protein
VFILIVEGPAILSEIAHPPVSGSRSCIEAPATGIERHTVRNERIGLAVAGGWGIRRRGRGRLPGVSVSFAYVVAEHGEPAQSAVVVEVCVDGKSHPDRPIMVGEANVNGHGTTGLGDPVDGVEQSFGLLRVEVFGPVRSEQPTHWASGTAGPGRVDIDSVCPRIEFEYHDRCAG